MQFMKHLVAAAALTVAGSAMATTYEGGVLVESSPKSVTKFVGTAGSFSDVIDFDVLSSISLQANVSSSTVEGLVQSPLLGLSLSIYNGTTLVAPSASGVYSLLAGTNYSFHISGTSSFNGLYSVNYFATPTPAVPEAGTMAMTLAGLGLVGLVAARRRRV